MPGTTLFRELIYWISRFEQVAVIIVIALFVGSSIGVIYSAHLTRQMYGQLQSQQQIQDDLDSEYEKFLLEQSAWANFTRIEQLAREELKMGVPAQENMIVVRDDHPVTGEYDQ